MRLYTYTKFGSLEEIAECKNPFRTDSSFKNFCRAIFKRAVLNNYTIIFTPHNKQLVTSVLPRIKIDNNE